MRILVEGIRLEDCDLIRFLDKSLKKIEENTSEASVRTPPTISSRQLIEENLELILGSRIILEELKSRICSEAATLK